MGVNTLACDQTSLLWLLITESNWIMYIKLQWNKFMIQNCLSRWARVQCEEQKNDLLSHTRADTHTRTPPLLQQQKMLTLLAN